MKRAIYLALTTFSIFILLFLSATIGDVCCTDTRDCKDAFCASGTNCMEGWIPCDCATYCCPGCGCCPTTSTTTTSTTTTVSPTTSTTTTSTTTTIPSTETNCTNGIDDDRDGLVDCADPDCAGKDVNGDYLADCCQKKDDCTHTCFNVTRGIKPDICKYCEDSCMPSSYDCVKNQCVYGSEPICGCVAYESDCTNKEDDDRDGLVDCADPDCAGKVGPNGYICCQNYDDCKNANQTCDSQGYEKRYAECQDNECKKCDPCRYSSDCANNWCCDREISTSYEGQCRGPGWTIEYGGNSYLCDPPMGFELENLDLLQLISYNPFMS